MKAMCNLAAAVGFVIAYLGVSTSDYYVLELGQSEPAHVWPMIWIGLALMMPTLIRIVREELA